jgi:hypothetical protein
MSIEKIHKACLSSRFLLFTVLLAFVAVRLYHAGSDSANPYLWSSMLIQIGIALLLLHTNHVFNIIQKRSFLPALFYMLFTGTNPAFFYDWKGSIAALCFILCNYFLFDSYQKSESQINSLNISLLLILGSFLWAPLLFFFPFFWYGFYHFRCLNRRVFLANLLGFVVIFLFLFTISLFLESKAFFLSFLPSLNELLIVRIPDLTLVEWIICGFMLFFYILFGFNLFLFDISEKIRTISILNYFYFLSFVLLVFFLLQSEYKSCWAMLLYIPAALLSAYFFSRSNKRVVHYLMLLFMLFFIGTGVWQYIRP